MSTTKNALIRYKVLDKCFRNTGRRYFIQDLIDECNNILAEIDPETTGISLRQIREDISFMKRAEGWSIELGEFRVGKKMFYRYTDTNFSINNMPLNELEINQLKSAIDIVSQFKGMPQFEWVNELIPKLKQGIAKDEKSTPIIEFENNENLKGIEHLGALYNAILYKKILKIVYQPFVDEKSQLLTFHPYFLKQYNNRWFVFGYNPENGKFNWNLALDRIESIAEQIGKFQKNTEIDWRYYFEDIIGVTKPLEAEEEKVILEFYGITGKYIESKPLHGSQKSNWIDTNTLEVKLELIINYEFERVILSYADTVKVLKPITLANSIKKRIKSANALYKAR